MRSAMKCMVVVVLVEMVVGVSWYLFSAGGRSAYYAHLDECASIEKKVSDEQQAIDILQTELDEWQTDTFLLERDARERLALSRPDEEVFVI